MTHAVITQGAIDFFESHNTDPLPYLLRHAVGDWGDVNEEDRRANEYALTNGLRLFSVYKITPKDTIWIITEADRSITTILLPSEY